MDLFDLKPDSSEHCSTVLIAFALPCRFYPPGSHGPGWAAIDWRPGPGRTFLGDVEACASGYNDGRAVSAVKAGRAAEAHADGSERLSFPALSLLAPARARASSLLFEAQVRLECVKRQESLAQEEQCERR